MASDADAVYDDEVVIKADELTPVVTWGVNPASPSVDAQTCRADRL
jgi:homoaconitase/3-isopropylmalate dehydratase large subunit